MALSQTNLCNKRPYSSEIVPYEHAHWSAAIDALMIVASLSDSLCSARQRSKGVSERSKLTPCILIHIHVHCMCTLSNHIHVPFLFLSGLP